MEKLLGQVQANVEIVACSSNANDAISAIMKHQPDLVILDIMMPGQNGFDLLKQLSGVSFEILFVTAHNSFMEKAFRFSAIDYLLKPVEEELLADAIKRVERRVAMDGRDLPLKNLLHQLSDRGKKLCIPSQRGFEIEDIAGIIYCEANNNYTNIHFAGRRSICSSKPILEYENMLKEYGFVRIHKSSLVNLDHIKEYLRGEGGSIILSNGMEVEVSRRRKDHLLGCMKQFFRS